MKHCLYLFTAASEVSAQHAVPAVAFSGSAVPPLWPHEAVCPVSYPGTALWARALALGEDNGQAPRFGSREGDIALAIPEFGMCSRWTVTCALLLPGPHCDAHFGCPAVHRGEVRDRSCLPELQS